MPQLAGRVPDVAVDRLPARLVVSPRFADSSFDGYLPDPAHPFQAAAKQTLRGLAQSLSSTRAQRRLRLPPRRHTLRPGRGLYLDGGFGVGKTHLLAATWNAATGPKAYGSFVTYTHLVGALGFRRTVEALSTCDLICIDEFELDDPGDTVLMARLLREVTEAGATVVATSNTLPEALGEGRFSAEDFLREIQALAATFAVVTVDGPDYRHRGHEEALRGATEDDLQAMARVRGAAVDDFDALLAHLATLHPSRYGALLDGVTAVGWRGLAPLHDQSVALRLVVLVDRLYEQQIPVVATGQITEIFSDEMLAGGYRKKYLRATSRLTALAREAAALLGAAHTDEEIAIMNAVQRPLPRPGTDA